MGLLKFFRRTKPTKFSEPFQGANLQLLTKEMQIWQDEMIKRDEIPFILIARNKQGQDTVYCLSGTPVVFFREQLIKMLHAIDRGAQIKDLSNLKNEN